MPVEVLTADQLRQIVTGVRRKIDTGTTHERRDAIAVLLGCLGLRITEIANLTIGDYDTATKTLRVKTLKGGRPRRLPIKDRLHASFLEQIGHRTDPDAPLIANDHGRPLDTRNLRRRWHTWSLDILGRITRFHNLRHTAAHWIYAHSDKDIFTVQRVLGHRDLTSTHVYLRSLADIAPSLPDDADVTTDIEEAA